MVHQCIVAAAAAAVAAAAAAAVIVIIAAASLHRHRHGGNGFRDGGDCFSVRGRNRQRGNSVEIRNLLNLGRVQITNRKQLRLLQLDAIFQRYHRDIERACG